ncbi:MAG: hypothetical protein M3N57_03710 [Actinomycetota bacterium]|nr:hypothetical protein [Actinomycetota bacterium]
MSASIRRTATTVVSVLAVAVLLAGPVGADEAPPPQSPVGPSAPQTEAIEPAVQAPADAVDPTATTAAPRQAVDTILEAADQVADRADQHDALAPVGSAVRTVTAMAREATAPTPPSPAPADGDATQATGGPVTGPITDLGAETAPAPVRQASSVPIGMTSLTGLRLDRAQMQVAEADLAAFTSPNPALAPPNTGTSAPLASVPIDRAQRILVEILFGAALLVVATAALVGELGPDRRPTAG